jgi:PKD repeat protein
VYVNGIDVTYFLNDVNFSDSNYVSGEGAVYTESIDIGFLLFGFGISYVAFDGSVFSLGVQEHIAALPTISGDTGQVIVFGLTVDFVGTPRIIDIGDTVQFSDMSGGWPDSWLWDFGDGDTSIAQHPLHQYTVPGLYDVTLSATSSGDSGQRFRPEYILVRDYSVSLDFVGNPTTIHIGDTVDFVLTLGFVPALVMWTFGYGFNYSLEINSSHRYQMSGVFTVRVVVVDMFGNMYTEEKVGYITVLPYTLDFTGTPKSGPAPLKVAFTAEMIP